MRTLKKKGLLLLLMIMFCAALTAVTAYAEDVEGYLSEDGLYEYEFYEDGTIYITGYYGNERNVVIPNEIDGYEVYAIYAGFAFMDPEIETIEIEEGIYEIGDAVFSYSEAQTVYLPSTAWFAGDERNPFSRAWGLKNVYVAENGYLYDIDGVVFDSDTDELLYYPHAKTEKAYNIPADTYSIKSYAFSEVEGLQTVGIPADLSSINPAAFQGCPNIKEFIVAPGNKAYSEVEGMLYDKTGTKLISFPFNKTTGIYELPMSTKNIAEGAFAGSSFYVCAAKAVIIPNSVTYLDEDCDLAWNAVFYCDKGSAAERYAKAQELERGSDYDVHEYKKVVTRTATFDRKGYVDDICKKCNYYNVTYDICKLKQPVISYATATYDGKYKKPSVTVKDTAGVALKQGVDYKITYKNNLNAGTATVTVTGIGSYYKGATTTKTFKIKPAAAANCSVALSKKTAIYNGKVQKPNVTVKTKGGKKLIKGTDYTVTYVNGCKNVGAHKVKVTFKGNYTGSKTSTLTINPKTTSINKLTKPGKKQIKVTWKKQTAQVTGYEIKYSVKQNMTGSKTVTIKNNKTTKKTIKNLKAKKKYYVQIRTYKTVDGKKYYSAWSAKKSIVTK